MSKTIFLVRNENHPGEIDTVTTDAVEAEDRLDYLNKPSGASYVVIPLPPETVEMIVALSHATGAVQL